MGDDLRKSKNEGTERTSKREENIYKRMNDHDFCLWGFNLLGLPEEWKTCLSGLYTRLLRGWSVSPPTLLSHSLRIEPGDTNSWLHRTWARETLGLAKDLEPKMEKTLDESLTLTRVWQ